MRNKTKSSNTFLPLLPSSWAQLHSRFSTSPLSSAGGRGMGVTVSSSHAVSVAPSSSGGGLLTLFPSTSEGSLPQETVLHKLLQCASFPWDAALHELPQCGSLPTGCCPSGTGWSSVGPHRVTSPASKPAPAWAPLSKGPQVLAGACSS